MVTIAIVGKSKSGKSHAIRQAIGRVARNEYVPTIGVNHHSCDIITSDEEKFIRILDVPGNESYQGNNLREELSYADGFILTMGDEWIDYITKFFPGKPIVRANCNFAKYDKHIFIRALSDCVSQVIGKNVRVRDTIRRTCANDDNEFYMDRTLATYSSS